jgi:cold shock CspA family protein
VFVHISAVQTAELTGLEDKKLSYDVVTERGKQGAPNLKLV